MIPRWQEMMTLDREGLEAEIAGDFPMRDGARLVSELSCLSKNIERSSPLRPVLAAFAEKFADDHPEAPLSERLDAYRLAANNYAEDGKPAAQAADKFRDTLEELAGRNLDKAWSAAALARSDTIRTGRVLDAVLDFMIERVDSMPQLYNNCLANEAANLTEEQVGRLVHRLAFVAGEAPYDVSLTLRTLMDERPFDDGPAMSRARDLFQGLSGNPELLKEVLDREYGMKMDVITRTAAKPGHRLH